MEKKNIIIGSVAIVIGLLLGYLIFGGGKQKNNEGDGHNHEEMSTSEKKEIWTCSMHPQVRQTEPGDCPICGMDLILLDKNVNDNPLVLEMTEDAIKLANIQTTIVGGSGSSVNEKGILKLSGKIKANETTAASVVSHISGRIEKLFISFTGEKVYKGQKIAAIYSPNLITAQKELLEAHKVKEVNPSLFQATKNKLKYWKITEQQISEILTSKKVKESFYIYADHSGVVTKRKVSVGDHLMEGGVLFEIQNLNKLWVVFDVYESDLAKIKKGALIKFTTPSVPNKVFSTRVSFIDPIVNPNTRATSVRVEVSNYNNQLKPEMFVNGELTVSTNSLAVNKQVLVPKTAVLWTGEQSVVYVKLPNKTVPSFEFREVTLGDATGKNYTVLKGVKRGDEIVTNGAFVIDASAQLNNQNSMMNRLLNNVSEEESVEVNYQEETPAKFKEELQKVVEAYLKLKDGLTKDDIKIAAKKAQIIANELKNVEMKLLKGDAHMYWMDQSKVIKKSSLTISKLTNIKKGRIAFKNLSNAIIATIKAFGTNKKEYYLQYCPMAIDDDGAYWLSNNKKVVNPYFGNAMLTCGEVKQIIN